MPASTTETMITLKHGFVVPESVVVWLLDAENRGLTFEILATRKLRVSPSQKVQDADDRFIRDHRDLLIACVEYIARMGEPERVQ